MKKRKINFQSVFYIAISLIIFLFVSCDIKLTSPSLEDVATNVQIEKAGDGRLKLSWDFEVTTDDTLEFDIFKESGGTGFEYYYLLPHEKREFYDNASTSDSLVYAYYIRVYNVTKEEMLNPSETVAYFSENTIPSDLQIEQISQDNVKLTWEDNCIGEEGFYIDRKIGNGNWQNKYQTLLANTTSFIDNTTIYETFYYRISAFYSKSASGAVSNSIIPILIAPSDLVLNKLENDKIRISWTDNSEGEEGFKIDRKIGFLPWNHSDPFTEIDHITVSEDIYSIIDDISFLNLDCADITYRIYAYKTEGISMYSEEASTKIRLNMIGSFDTTGDAKDIYISDYHGFVADYYSGLVILDFSDPTNPTELSNLDLPDRTHSVFVKGNKAYTLNQIGGFSIVGIDDIFAPVIMDTCTIPGSLKDIYIHDYDEHEYNRYAYIARRDRGVTILNLQGAPHYDENTPTIDTNGDALKVFVPQGQYSNYVFVANGTNNGFAMIDISDPSDHNPDVILFNGFDTSSLAMDIYVKENYVFLANGERGLDIIDITDIDNPVIISTVSNNGFVVGIYVYENYAFVLDKEFGLYVVNINDIANPYIQGSYNMESEPTAINFLGSYVYLTDNQGIKVIQVID